MFGPATYWRLLMGQLQYPQAIEIKTNVRKRTQKNTVIYIYIYSVVVVVVKVRKEEGGKFTHMGTTRT